MDTKLNDRLSFVAESTFINAYGFATTVEQDFYSCWCNYKALSGKEFNSAYTTNTKVTASFRVRYCSKLKEIDQRVHKIKYKDKFYNIVFIKDDEMDFWDFKTVAVNE